MSSGEIAISVRGLSKQYDIAREEKYTTLGEKMVARLRNPFRRPAVETFRALNDVSFDVRRGQVMGIIGRNGAGKSTLLKVLSRITEPTSGEIQLYGRVASLLEVGTGFHPELTGRENIYLNGAILGMRRAEIRKCFDAIVEFAEVSKFLDTPVKRYSSGMYVRLAFAVAAHLDPEILIVDEVLAVGDAEFQRKCLGKMKEVSENEGRTVLFVSHNMAAVRSLCNTGVMLQAGVVKHMGDAAKCVELYASTTDETDAEIVSHMNTVTSDMRLSRICINGSSSTHQEVAPQTRAIRVCVEGEIVRPIRMDLEITMSDRYDLPLAFFSPAHASGETPLLPAGPFRLQRDIALPEGLNKGSYLISLDLAHHNVCYWARGPRACILDFAGDSNATGSPMEYADQKGFIMLKGAWMGESTSTPAGRGEA